MMWMHNVRTYARTVGLGGEGRRVVKNSLKIFHTSAGDCPAVVVCCGRGVLFGGDARDNFDACTDLDTRDARADTLAILREEKVTDCGGVLHCFTEDRETAGKLLDMGFYISFSGIVTFRNAEQLRDAARYVPLDRLLVETDSPYLAPVPHRGKENQPAMVRDVAEYMAVLKGVSLEQLAQQTTQNFASLFHIDPARL